MSEEGLAFFREWKTRPLMLNEGYMVEGHLEGEIRLR